MKKKIATEQKLKYDNITIRIGTVNKALPTSFYINFNFMVKLIESDLTQLRRSVKVHNQIQKKVRQIAPKWLLAKFIVDLNYPETEIQSKKNNINVELQLYQNGLSFDEIVDDIDVFLLEMCEFFETECDDWVFIGKRKRKK